MRFNLGSLAALNPAVQEANMFTLFILAAVVLPLWHLVYESILLPGFRFRLRLELFQIRDEVRRIKIEGGRHVADQSFHHAERAVNNTLHVIGFIDPFVLVEIMDSLRRDPEGWRKATQSREEFEASATAELKALHKRTINLGLVASCVNSGAWFVYLVPLVLICMFAGRLIDALRMMVGAPPHRLDRLHPAGIYAPV